MISHTFIVNPSAGRGQAARVLPKIESLIQKANLQAEILLTDHEGHATFLAKNSSSPFVVAVGGDGTIHEVVNGLVHSGRTLGIIPAGSGNDLIKSLGIPIDAEEAFSLIISGEIRMIDLGSAMIEAKSYFINGLGIGFDACVADRTKQIRLFQGTLVYVVAVIQTLGRYVAPNFTITVNGQITTGRKLLIAIGNGRCAGGGFYLTPAAELDDGQLDVCMIDDLTVWQILSIMPKVMSGSHIRSRQVQMTQVKNIQIESDEGFFVHADGEIIGRNVKNIRVDIQHKCLKVICSSYIK